MASFYYHCCWFLYFDFLMIPHHGWLQPLVGITDYIGNTLLSNRIIAIYHHFFIQKKWRLFTGTVVNCYIWKVFYDPSSCMNETDSWDCWFYCKYSSERSYFRYIDIMTTDFIWSTLLRNVTLLFILVITNYLKKTFGKISIHTESRLSKENKHFASDKFAQNQEYQSLAWLIYQWSNLTLYTSVFKFPPGGGPILHVFE